ncbi:MAG: hypothetical protein AAFY57_04345 [Cyanobacteria bacterium J06642_2]
MNRSFAPFAALAVLLATIAEAGLPLPASANPYDWYPSTEVAQNDGGWRPINPQPIPRGPQQFQLETSMAVLSGENIPLTFRSNETLFLDPSETRAFSLQLESDVRDSFGNVVIPSGAIVSGQFQPVSGGSQFVTNSVEFNGQTFPLSAQSARIASRKDPRQVSGGAIAQDAAIGAGIGVLLGGITGDKAIATEEVLGAAAISAVVGNVTAPSKIVVRPNTPLTLQVTQDFRPAI